MSCIFRVEGNREMTFTDTPTEQIRVRRHAAGRPGAIPVRSLLDRRLIAARHRRGDLGRVGAIPVAVLVAQQIVLGGAR